MEAIWGILFIGFVVLVPLVMTVLLIVLAFRRRAIADLWRDSGDRSGLRLVEQETTEHEELVRRLESTLFSMDAHDEHRVTHALTGMIDGHRTWVANTVSTGEAPTKRRAAAKHRTAATGIATCVETAGFPHGLVLERPRRSEPPEASGGRVVVGAHEFVVAVRRA